MTALLLPYWQRQAAADRAFALLDQHYAGWKDLRIIVVDDGSPEPFVLPKVRLNVSVMRMSPAHAEPKSPVKCWNMAARYAEARGHDWLVLSCVEVLHEKPVLRELVEHAQKLGPKHIVLAAAWCPEQKDWHTHSSVPVPTCPPGTGLAFLGAIHRDLYWKAGGFDEDYRDGAGYEDRDFIRRVGRAGGIYHIRDDLVVTHPKTDATIRCGGERFARNEAMYLRKWGLSS